MSVKVHLDPCPLFSYVVEDDGCVWPVTDMYDEDGEETKDIHAATVIVAGEGQYFLTVSLAGMELVQ